MQHTANFSTNFLKELGLEPINPGTSTGQNHFAATEAQTKDIYSPVDGNLIGKISFTTQQEYNQVIETAQEAFKVWRKVPAPKRGEIIRQYGNVLRKHKDNLGQLVSYFGNCRRQKLYGPLGATPKPYGYRCNPPRLSQKYAC
jgi:hypothetical protein